MRAKHKLVVATALLFLPCCTSNSGTCELDSAESIQSEMGFPQSDELSSPSCKRIDGEFLWNPAKVFARQHFYANFVAAAYPDPRSPGQDTLRVSTWGKPCPEDQPECAEQIDDFLSKTSGKLGFLVRNDEYVGDEIIDTVIETLGGEDAVTALRPIDTLDSAVLVAVARGYLAPTCEDGHSHVGREVEGGFELVLRGDVECDDAEDGDAQRQVHYRHLLHVASDGVVKEIGREPDMTFRCEGSCAARKVPDLPVSPLPSVDELTAPTCTPESWFGERRIAPVWHPAEVLADHLDADYVGVSFAVDGWYPESIGSRVSEHGEPCEGLDNPTSCEEEIFDVLGVDDGPAALVVRHGQTQESYMRDEVVAALTPIATMESAILAAIVKGYVAPRCDGEHLEGAVEVADGFNLVLGGDVECTHTGPRGIQRTVHYRHLIHVSSEGKVTSLEREPEDVSGCEDFCRCRIVSTSSDSRSFGGSFP